MRRVALTSTAVALAWAAAASVEAADQQTASAGRATAAD